MGLENRLRQLESKIQPVNSIPEHQFDLDQSIEHLGLVPVTVRELATSKGSSLVEAMCEMLGIEVREFKRDLQEASYPVRW